MDYVTRLIITDKQGTPSAAFICVIVTYFGVNYLLGGMHSYA